MAVYLPIHLVISRRQNARCAQIIAAEENAEMATALAKMTEQDLRKALAERQRKAEELQRGFDAFEARHGPLPPRRHWSGPTNTCDYCGVSTDPASLDALCPKCRQELAADPPRNGLDYVGSVLHKLQLPFPGQENSALWVVEEGIFYVWIAGRYCQLGIPEDVTWHDNMLAALPAPMTLQEALAADFKTIADLAAPPPPILGPVLLNTHLHAIVEQEKSKSTELALYDGSGTMRPAAM